MATTELNQVNLFFRGSLYIFLLFSYNAIGQTSSEGRLISCVRMSFSLRHSRWDLRQLALNSARVLSKLTIANHFWLGFVTGKTAIDSDLSCHRHPKSTLNACVNGLACNYLADLHYKQSTYYPPTGPPVFSVTFTNTCLDCPLSNIHIGCGDFSSQSLVDPSIFKRLAYNDCLLNDGAALAPQNTIAFQYVSTFQYPMTVFTADNSACANWVSFGIWKS